MPSDQDSNSSEQEPNQNQGFMTKVKQLQAITGLIISLYVSAHSLNHFAMHFGFETHKRIMSTLRIIYTYPPIEKMLLSSIFVHSMLAIYRYKGIGKDWPTIVFQSAGWFQLLVLPMHIFASRYAGSKLAMKEYDVTQVAIASRMLPLVFIPYFSLLSLTGVVHMIAGVGKAGALLKIKALSKIPNRGKSYLRLATILGACSVSSALAICGVYFRYPYHEEDLVRKAYLHHLPRFIGRRLVLEKGQWFAIIKFFD
jgi:hypothetical protein